MVGSRLCTWLHTRGHQVIGLGRGVSRIGTGSFHSLDLTNSASVQRLLSEVAPDAVINCASMTEVDGCERDPSGAFAANCTLPATLATETRRLGAHLVHISTDYVFDGEAGNYREEDVPNPRGTYAVTKYMGELAVETLAGTWSIGRVAVVYGFPAAARPNFGAWLLGALQKGQPLKLFSDQYVSPTLALNAVHMLTELAERKLEGVWHLTGATPVNRFEFAQALCERFGLSAAHLQPSKLADAQLASPRPKNSTLSVEKAAKHLEAKPLNLNDALNLFYQEWKESQ